MLGYSTTLLLAATCLLVNSGHSEFLVTTCEGNTVHRMSCESGVIDLQTALYGRADTETCSEGKTPQQIANTECSLADTVSAIKTRCNGKTVCEISPHDFSSNDPCSDTFKYLQTKHRCLPAHHFFTCEHSFAHLQCDQGQVIFVHSADYGRHDLTTCSYKRVASQTANTDCSGPTSKVAESCNGKNSCVIKASNSEFGDTCNGIVKYLEVAYLCEYPVSPPEES
uniref:L-rhamnose-binding lectin SML-like n=1 Tax=Semicossyphus pulcher TaxID=241346 RepID=UPI0037E94973